MFRLTQCQLCFYAFALEPDCRANPGCLVGIPGCVILYFCTPAGICRHVNPCVSGESESRDYPRVDKKSWQMATSPAPICARPVTPASVDARASAVGRRAATDPMLRTWLAASGPDPDGIRVTVSTSKSELNAPCRLIAAKVRGSLSGYLFSEGFSSDCTAGFGMILYIASRP